MGVVDVAGQAAAVDVMHGWPCASGGRCKMARLLCRCLPAPELCPAASPSLPCSGWRRTGAGRPRLVGVARAQPLCPQRRCARLRRARYGGPVSLPTCQLLEAAANRRIRLSGACQGRALRPSDSPCVHCFHREHHSRLASSGSSQARVPSWADPPADEPAPLLSRAFVSFLRPCGYHRYDRFFAALPWSDEG